MCVCLSVSGCQTYPSLEQMTCFLRLHLTGSKESLQPYNPRQPNINPTYPYVNYVKYNAKQNSKQHPIYFPIKACD